MNFLRCSGIIFVAIICFFTACSHNEQTSPQHDSIKLTANALLLDVRTPDEFKAGHVQGALNLPHDNIKQNIANIAPDKNTPLYIYCRSGRRVKIAIAELEKLGYKNLHDLGGISNAAEKLQTPVVK